MTTDQPDTWVAVDDDGQFLVTIWNVDGVAAVTIARRRWSNDTWGPPVTAVRK